MDLVYRGSIVKEEQIIAPRDVPLSSRVFQSMVETGFLLSRGILVSHQ